MAKHDDLEGEIDVTATDESNQPEHAAESPVEEQGVADEELNPPPWVTPPTEAWPSPASLRSEPVPALEGFEPQAGEPDFPIHPR